MQLKITWNEEERIFDVGENESDVFQQFGKILAEIPIPNDVLLECAYGTAMYHIKARGSFVKNGVVHKSMYVEEVSYNISSLLTPGDYKETYLTCVNVESNNYKFYHLKPRNNKIHATYGRIGSERGEAFGVKDLQTPYPWHMFWIRYYEKLSKGYIDQSDIYLKKEEKPQKKVDTKANDVSTNPDSEYLYHFLYSHARQVVRTHLKSTNVTLEQVKKSKYYFNQMCERKTVKGFNSQLTKLLSVCPRKTRYVNTLLANTISDFQDIIAREENLISAMEALAAAPEDANTNSFENMSIEVYEATEQQEKAVMKKLSDTLKPKVKKVYRVINKKHTEKFNSYLAKNDIKQVKQLWHGSRTENWFSIIVNGLQLNPDAVITGKMFGNGIYFAPSSEKSWNYTSCNGAGWTNGTSDTGFMGLYATAYGVPLDVTASQQITKKYLDSLHKNCVHAHAGTHLRNDEIVFYDESATILNYIVEFAA